MDEFVVKHIQVGPTAKRTRQMARVPTTKKREIIVTYQLSSVRVYICNLV